eukprot:CAMPEP_0171115098 /NCGR_PEP_ID=MMETSP0766_2-20121228/86917_1 /TAXON_ID=439317 /ORGANISM="Gambierdiscus australes, Strain CAWD 149" /LENGTH=67 /DNA_ID=CAMNT_0011577429 /DNA_START=250 /DNA_END=450 /DNA_ORIENTATION=+
MEHILHHANATAEGQKLRKELARLVHAVAHFPRTQGLASSKAPQEPLNDLPLIARRQLRQEGADLCA